MLVQRMAEEAVQVTFTSIAGARGRLLSSIEEFDRNHQTLRQGNGLVGKEHVPETSEDTHSEILDFVEKEWNTFRPLVKEVADKAKLKKGELNELFFQTSLAFFMQILMRCKIKIY